MLKGICIAAEPSTVLVEGEKYYLFPNGPSHVYVSTKPNPKAHKGCYRADRFEIEAGRNNLVRDKLYTANLVYTGNYTKEKKMYYVKPSKTHGYFYADRELKSCRGCFPLEWFSDFQEVDEEEIKVPTVPDEFFHMEDNGQLVLF